MKRTSRQQKRDAYAESMAKRIRQLREHKFGSRRGTKAAAARAVGVTPADWRGYEAGVIPGADKIQAMCEVFGCEANWLLGLSSSKQIAASQIRAIDALAEFSRQTLAMDERFTKAVQVLGKALTDPAATQEVHFELGRWANVIGRATKAMQEETEKERA